MTEPLVRHVADVPPVPWRNGGGETRPLFESADGALRISLAAIAGPGPFSTFAGEERLLVPLGPGALVLAHGDDAPPSRPRTLEPYRFSGDWTTSAADGTGELDALNAFARRGVVEVSAEPWRLGKRRRLEELTATWTVLFLTDGAAVVRVSNEEESLELEGGELLVIERPLPGEALEVTGTDAEAEALLLLARSV